MGYACPVCEEPQQDAEHLANHLAFQAMTHGGPHESWLDDHAPDWADGGPSDLAPRVAALAPDAEYDVVFEDTTDDGRERERFDPDLQGGAHGHDHGHAHDHGHGADRGAGVDVDAAALDPEARDVVESARELTREMLADDADDDGRDEGTD